MYVISAVELPEATRCYHTALTCSAMYIDMQCKEILCQSPGGTVIAVDWQTWAKWNLVWHLFSTRRLSAWISISFSSKHAWSTASCRKQGWLLRRLISEHGKTCLHAPFGAVGTTALNRVASVRPRGRFAYLCRLKITEKKTRS